MVGARLLVHGPSLAHFVTASIGNAANGVLPFLFRGEGRVGEPALLLRLEAELLGLAVRVRNLPRPDYSGHIEGSGHLGGQHHGLAPGVN